MKALYFCPSRFEIPRAYRQRCRIFGMGKKKAEALARELNLQMPSENIILFGCAGALSENLKAGDVFRITHLIGSKKTITLPGCENLPPVKLASSPSIVPHETEKILFRNLTGADLVDCEMLYFYEALKPELQAKVIFIRGVMDELQDDLSFLVSPNWFSWRHWKGLSRTARAWFVYLRRMQNFLNEF